MNSRATLLNALSRGEIKDNEIEIERALLLSSREDLELYQKTPFFHDVIAAVWRNKKVLLHIRQFAVLSFHDYNQILKKVELTNEECQKIHNAVMKSADADEVPACKEVLSKDKKAVIIVAEELWKIVFSSN